jgi:hypothetical protein
MDTGFGIYGALMVLCAAMANACARAGNYDQQPAWAVRPSRTDDWGWLYRVEYGLWSVPVGGFRSRAGHSGCFDAITVYFFYLPNSSG